MNRHDQLITRSRQTLAALRASTAHAQQLIDELSHTLDQLPVPTPSETAPDRLLTSRPVASEYEQAPLSSPAPQPSPQPTSQLPAATGPGLTTEQKAIRAAAVLGSLITFIGACFGVALAIQTGLLGPAGRAVGALLFALVLLGAGYLVDVRRGPSPGVTALYVTSFLVILADLLYAGRFQEWLSSLGMVSLFIVAWAVYLGVAVWRRNLWLVACMCAVAFPYQMMLWPDTAAACAVTMLAPLLALGSTWILPAEARGAMPRLTLCLRLLAGGVLAWQLAFAGIMSTFAATGLLPATVLAYAGVFMLIAGERFFPFPALGSYRASAVLTGVIAPAAVILASFSLAQDKWLWLPPLAGVAATLGTGVLWRSASQPGEAADTATAAGMQANGGRDCLTGWLVFTPFLFLPAAFDASSRAVNDPAAEMLAVLVFIAVFVAVVAALRFCRVNRPTVMAAWTVGLFFITLQLHVRVLDSTLIRPGASYDIIKGIALAAFLIFAAAQRKIWQEIPAQIRGLFAGAGLVVGMVAVVTVSTALGCLIAPVRNPGFGVSPSAEAGFFVGHMIVSIAWVALAAWLLVRIPGTTAGGSGAADTKTARVTGLILAALATGKLVFFDMASLSGIPRVLTFIVCGLLLIAVSVLGDQRKNPEESAEESHAKS